jgi:hypothetical protein
VSNEVEPLRAQRVGKIQHVSNEAIGCVIQYIGRPNPGRVPALVGCYRSEPSSSDEGQQLAPRVARLGKPVQQKHEWAVLGSDRTRCEHARGCGDLNFGVCQFDTSVNGSPLVAKTKIYRHLSIRSARMSAPINARQKGAAQRGETNRRSAASAAIGQRDYRTIRTADAGDSYIVHCPHYRLREPCRRGHSPPRHSAVRRPASCGAPSLFRRARFG